MSDPRAGSGGAGLLRKAGRVAREAGAAAAREMRSTPGPGTTAPAKPQRWDPTLTSEWYAWCAATGYCARPQYLWPLLHATNTARALEVPKIAALEFGVAGGNGLLAMERDAATAASHAGTEVDIYGFDTGSGMPTAIDRRDAPWLIEPAYFKMDEAALRARLSSAELVLGPVAETVSRWADSGHAPVGFIAFDLDYYSSTMSAFAVLEGDSQRLLPRVPCYFDDMFGYGWTDCMGVRAAIDDFNSTHSDRKIAKIHGLRYELPHEEYHEPWHEKMYVVHVFDHPRYAEREGRIDERWFDAHRLESA